MLLTREWPWKDLKEKEAQKRVQSGDRPQLPKSVQSSNDPVDKVLMEGMRLCHKQDPKLRATARQVETLLKEKLQELYPGNKHMIN